MRAKRLLVLEFTKPTPQLGRDHSIPVPVTVAVTVTILVSRSRLGCMDCSMAGRDKAEWKTLALNLNEKRASKEHQARSSKGLMKVVV